MPGVLSSIRAANLGGGDVVDALRRAARPVSGGGDIAVEDAPNGLGISRRRDYAAVVSLGFAEVAETGPDGEDQPTTAVYYLKWTRAMASDPLVTPETEDAPGVGEAIVFPAVNLAEIEDETHALAVGTRCLVFSTPDANDADRLYFIPALPADVTAAASVDSNAEGGGDYLGTLLAGSSTADGTADLTMPEGMTAGDPCLILHLPENGLPTHWLATGSYVEGKVVGRLPAGEDPEADPARWILVVGNGTARTASPVSLVGTGDTAATTSWDRRIVTVGDAKGDCPVTRTYQTRTYLDAATKTFYYFTQTETLDAGGKVVSISAETRYAADTGEEC